MAKILRAISTNAGVRTWYKRRLITELKAMRDSVRYWLMAAYRKREDSIVGDANPVADILARFDKDARRWTQRWNWLSSWLACKVVAKMDSNTTSALRSAFKAAGFSVAFNSTRNLNTVTKALIAENVNLIKSIGSQYLTEVRGIVTRGVSMGRDLEYVSDELEKRYGITERRAAFIARDQCDKASQAIQRTRDAEVGIEEGIWVHLPGLKTSRHTHEEMDGKRFRIDEGLYDSDVGYNVLCGELPGCRCTYRRVLPEFGD